MGIDVQASHVPQQTYNANLSEPSLFFQENTKPAYIPSVSDTLAGDQPVMKLEEQDVGFNGTGAPPSGDAGIKKKVRKKWTIEETKMLVDGCNKVSQVREHLSTTC